MSVHSWRHDNFFMGKAKIDTKLPQTRVDEITAEICVWGDEHCVGITFGTFSSGEFGIQYSGEGSSTAYCKGMLMEVKTILNEKFGKKNVNMTLEAW